MFCFGRMVLAVLGLLGGAATGQTVEQMPTFDLNVAAVEPALDRELVVTALSASLPEDRESRVRLAQAALSDLGFDPGPIDGIVGPRTAAALARFEADIGAVDTWNADIGEAEVRALRLARSALSGASSLDRDEAFGAIGQLWTTTPGLFEGATRAELRALLRYQGPSKGCPDDGTIDLSCVVNFGKFDQTTQAAIEIAREAVMNSSTPSAEPYEFPPVATRVFSTAEEYPPAEYRGYGIVAFNSWATDEDRARHEMICKAYLASLPATDEVGEAKPDQFVTVWPLRSAELANALNFFHKARVSSADICRRSVTDYDLRLGLKAIENGHKVGFPLAGLGPYLLGWIPGATFGAEDAIVAVVDFSTVKTYDDALIQFREWREEIVSDPEIIGPGTSREQIRRILRRKADQYGSILFGNLFAGD